MENLENTTIITDADLYTVHGWMITKLHLNGLELQIFSIIYNFTTDATYGEFNGSIDYLSKWTGYERHTISKTLNGLVKKNLLSKDSHTYTSAYGPRTKCTYKAIFTL